MAQLVVDTFFDTVDPDDGRLSLREAVDLAGQINGTDEIHFNVGGLGAAVTLDSTLVINSEVAIVGNQLWGIEIEAGNGVTPIEIASGTTAAFVRVNFTGANVAGAEGTDGVDGTNGFNGDPGATSTESGAPHGMAGIEGTTGTSGTDGTEGGDAVSSIINRGVLVLSDVTVSSNTAIAGSGGDGGHGGDGGDGGLGGDGFSQLAGTGLNGGDGGAGGNGALGGDGGNGADGGMGAIILNTSSGSLILDGVAFLGNIVGGGFGGDAGAGGSGGDGGQGGDGGNGSDGGAFAGDGGDGGPGGDAGDSGFNAISGNGGDRALIANFGDVVGEVDRVVANGPPSGATSGVHVLIPSAGISGFGGANGIRGIADMGGVDGVDGVIGADGMDGMADLNMVLGDDGEGGLVVDLDLGSSDVMPDRTTMYSLRAAGEILANPIYGLTFSPILEGTGGNTFMTIRVVRSGDVSQAGSATIGLTHVDTNSSDFVGFLGGGANSIMLDFNPGETERFAALEVVADADAEGDEAFVLDLVTTVDALGGLGALGNRVVTGILVNDDVQPGTEGDDDLVGGLFDDIFNLLGGNDTVHPKEGNDQAFLGPGNDTAIAGSGAGDDLYDGGDDIDTIVYSSTMFGVAVDLAAGTGSGDEVDNDIITGFENVVGGSGDDTIAGDGAANQLNGGDGDDVLSGAGGNDILRGSLGNDILAGGSGTDGHFGGDGVDTADYSAAPGAVTASLGSGQALGAAGNDSFNSIENLLGGSGGDTLTGNGAVNMLTGNGGNDRLVASDGDDILTGGAGNDDLFGQNQDDTLVGNAGDDLLNGGNGTDTADYAASSNALTVRLLAGTATGEGSDTLRGIENAIGGSAGDMIVGHLGVNEIHGRNGADTLNGAAGNDRLVGGNQDDNLNGANGNDELFGQEGDDTLIGGFGDDMLNGGNGTDTYQIGQPGGAVTVNLSTGIATGAAGTDTLVSIENIIGSNGTDTYTGSDGANRITGAGGNDTIHGMGGADEIFGQTGNDILNGGAGDDILNGDGGNDRFVVEDGTGDDTVVGFTPGAASGDQVDLSDFAGITDFTDLTTSHLAQAGPHAVITLDGDDSLTLNNVAIGSLVASDFIFA